MSAPSRCRRAVTRITTCKYEHSAVEQANPPVPQTQIKVRFNTILAQTAISALRIGILESNLLNEESVQSQRVKQERSRGRLGIGGRKSAMLEQC